MWKVCGKIEKGNFKKDASVLCCECMDFYETCDSLCSGKHIGKYQNNEKLEEGLPDALKDILNGNNMSFK